jgi:hypothetical protein
MFLFASVITLAERKLPLSRRTDCPTGRVEVEAEGQMILISLVTQDNRIIWQVFQDQRVQGFLILSIQGLRLQRSSREHQT